MAKVSCQNQFDIYDQTRERQFHGLGVLHNRDPESTQSGDWNDRKGGDIHRDTPIYDFQMACAAGFGQGLSVT